jgi:hypothetical protein
MKPARQFLPPRQSVVYGHTRRMLDQTATNYQSFAMALADSYLSSVAPDVRGVPFRLGDDPSADMKHNAQILRRYLDGTVKALPADLEDAWVMALPEPYRGECERDLSRRRGLLVVHQLQTDEAGEAVGLARLLLEFGQFVEALGPALADGRISEADAQFARRILNESDDLISAVLSVRRQVQNILPGA